jgi:hypothetical protein
MKKILVVYYSQTGQLTRIVDNILKPVRRAAEVTVTTLELHPEPPYPFPWSTYDFCDVFPESAAGMPCRLRPPAGDLDEDYDLIILAYTVWYLAPSIPVNSFLQSPEAGRLFRNRPVVTIIGCRNMWLLAQERVKRRIAGLGGRITGNIVLTDRTNNLVGVLTIAAWMLTGRKERLLKVFPLPGISEEDIEAAQRFGAPIVSALAGEAFALDQNELNDMGALQVHPSLLLMEKRISKVFAVWSRFIRQKGGPGAPNRRKRVRAFMVYLIVAVVLLAPLASAAAAVLKVLKKEKIRSEIAYFSQNALR